MLVLSLFPGIGLLDRAFEEEGFCVVRGPDLLWGGDVRTFHPPAGRFDGVIGGPPCQVFSRMRHINPKAGQRHGIMIPEFERVALQAAPTWFLMENVEAAPEPSVAGYIVRQQMVRDVWVGGVSNRKRRFSFGTAAGLRLPVQSVALHSTEPVASAMASGGTKPGIPSDRALRGKYMGWKTATALADMMHAQGLPPDFLSDAPFNIAQKCKVVGNGVPLPMGRAVARAVRVALGMGERVA